MQALKDEIWTFVPDLHGRVENIYKLFIYYTRKLFAVFVL